MRLKLDENMPRDAVALLTAHGHDVDTVPSEGLGGRGDATVLAAAVAERRMLITADRGFGDVRRYPPGTHAGILVVRSHRASVIAIMRVLQSAMRTQSLDELGGRVVIAEPAALRIRRSGAES